MQTRRGIARTWIYVVGLIGVLGTEFLLRDVLLPRPTTGTYIAIATAIEWLVAIVLLAVWVPRVEGKGLESIGLGKIKWRHIGWGALAFVVALIGSALLGPLLGFFKLQSIQALQPTLQSFGFPVRFSLFITGTLVEEVFYRGYLMERVTLLTGRLSVAAIASWLLFLAVHLRFFGLGPTISVSVLSAALVLLYAKERSLWPCIVCHGLNDALAYLIFPLFSMLFH
jgi:membrane protease YdiL (CAAX protease family)